MKNTFPSIPLVTPQPLDHLLNSAVVLNWDALTHSSASGRIRIEYHVGPDGAVEYLKLWNTAREYWSLVCEFSAHLAWSDCPRFCNGYHSRSLSHLLQSILMNQSLCTGTRTPNSNGMLEVRPPTIEEVEAAKVHFAETFRAASSKARGAKASP